MSEHAWPFHKGELAVQERVGVRDQVAGFAARVVHDHMPDQHRDFYASLPLIFVGAVDERGWPWASILAGSPGFITAPDSHTLEVKAGLLPGDPMEGALKTGVDIGILGLQLETRRRNRMSGRISQVHPDSISIAVNQAFGNCPQYIHRRTVAWQVDHALARETPAESSARLIGRAASLVRKADTMFIASAYSDGGKASSNGADVSHRGGHPGFVEIVEDHTIVFPDYSGNNHFNTLGNLMLNPRVGFLFVDFDSGDLVYLSGQATILWDGPEVEDRRGAQRLVECRIRSVLFLENALPLSFGFVDHSPSLSHLGKK